MCMCQHTEFISTDNLPPILVSNDNDVDTVSCSLALFYSFTLLFRLWCISFVLFLLILLFARNCFSFFQNSSIFAFNSNEIKLALLRLLFPPTEQIIVLSNEVKKFVL